MRNDVTGKELDDLIHMGLAYIDREFMKMFPTMSKIETTYYSWNWWWKLRKLRKLSKVKELEF